MLKEKSVIASSDRRAILKPGREKAIKNGHHWIFSGAIASLPTFENGDILPVHSASGELLGSAYFNKNSSILGRVVAFGAVPPLESIQKNISDAIALREKLFSSKQTTGYRLINGEGDRLPGLIVDCYGELLVVQISTLGMERLRPLIVEWLDAKFKPTAIYEKSNLATRKEEGLTERSGILKGTLPELVEIQENGLRFLISIEEGQKTGFFLDQREMRQLVKEMSAGKRVLNGCGYTGGFSVYAAAGGAGAVDTIDISGKALALARKNMALNGFKAPSESFLEEDLFVFLRESSLSYDFVILDPPAFAKKKKDVVTACRGYKDMNRLAMQKMPAGSFLLSCSCSYHIDEALFQTVLFQASVEAGRNVKIVGRHRLAADHPIHLCHPEGSYLKGFLLYIT